VKQLHQIKFCNSADESDADAVAVDYKKIGESDKSKLKELQRKIAVVREGFEFKQLIKLKSS
jgi:hypothetical protein